jgi:hypothetical protein
MRMLWSGFSGYLGQAWKVSRNDRYRTKDDTPQHHSQTVDNSSSSIAMIKEFARQSEHVVFINSS